MKKIILIMLILNLFSICKADEYLETCKFLTGFNSEKEVKERSRQIAIEQGCFKNVNDITEYWFAWTILPVFSLIIDSDDESKITTSEQSKLVTFENLDLDKD